MSIQNTVGKRRRRRSSAVPLTIVPALAAALTAAACSHRSYDPCEPVSYSQIECEAAVSHHGYWYGGTWYPHVYSYAPLYYYNGYHSYVSSGGRVRSISPTTYSAPSATPSRSSVVRGGFGGIGSGHASAGS
jgi:hypothetical protein